MNQFVESLSRLYQDGILDKDKIMELYKNGKLTVEDVNYILETVKES